MKNKIVMTSIIILLILSAATLSIYIFRYSGKTDLNQTNPSQEQLQKMQQSELKVSNAVDTVTRTYITKTYPGAVDVTIQTEFVGAGYGVINAAFSLNEQKNQRKVYLAYNDSQWTVLHESEGKISCTKVKELISTETVLTSLCE